jgi:pterin-4a-carbinolamine dehydratase
MRLPKPVPERSSDGSFSVLDDDSHRLSPQELQEALKTLKGWKEQEGQLKTHFCFKGFEGASAFVAELARIGQGMNHALPAHPVYNNVFLELTTPEQGGITEADITLAHRAAQLATQLKGSQRED